MKTKLCTIVVAAVMIVATLFVSCAPSKAVADDTVSVFFGELQAKAVNTDVYNKDTDTENGFGASSVDIPEVSALYWSYKAVKADGNFTAGQTTDMENNVKGYMPVKDGTGLDNTISGLSKGEWNFELQAFASAADRTAGTPVLFYGKTAEAQNLVDAVNTVTIATEWQYPEGKAGNVHFEITTDLIQNLTTDITTPYAVSKVTVQYDGQSAALELTAGDTSESTDDSDATKHTYTTVWTGDMKNTVPNGTRNFTYTFYVEGNKEIETSVTAPVMTNLTTNITGKATVTLTAGSVSVNFSGSTVPTDQPTIPDSSSTTDGIVTYGSAISKVGQLMTMGTYPATAATEYAEKAITWKALSVDTENKRALMISEKVLERRKFDEDNSSFSYAGSDIRTYLNGDFVTTYDIDDTRMVSGVEPYITSGSCDDKLFLLSKTEATDTSLFADNAARIAYNLSDSADNWWTRTSATDTPTFFIVNSLGESTSIANGNDTCGVRPAFWYTWE